MNEASNLFRINHLPEEADMVSTYDANRGFAGIVRFPKHIGLTGEAICKRKIIVLQPGERVTNLSSELDNMVGAASLESLMVAPCYDSDGVLRGAIQFVNKTENLSISEIDIRELTALLPTLAEIFRTADKTRVIYNSMVNMQLSMLSSNDNINNKLTGMESYIFNEMMTSITQA